MSQRAARPIAIGPPVGHAGVVVRLARRHLPRLGALVLVSAMALVAGCGVEGSVQVTGLGGGTTTTTSPGPNDSPVLRADVSEDVVARYDVHDGVLAAVVTGTDRAAYRERYQRFSQLVPDDLRMLVVGYVVFHPDDDSVAFVSSADDENDAWILGISDDGRDDRDLDATILHESAHLATLGDDQLDTSWRGDCPTFESVDGCLHPDAYLYDWVERYWTDLLPDLAEIEAAHGRRAAELIHQLYRAHRDRFVREYAATSPEEDLAETYAAWALDRTPTSDALAAKFSFFDQHDVFRAMKVHAQEAGAHR